MQFRGSGTLYLLPSPLEPGGWPHLPPAATEALARLEHFVVENLKPARRTVVHARKLQGEQRPDLSPVQFYGLQEPDLLDRLEAQFLQGSAIGLLSDAGAPGVADPGRQVVYLAHSRGCRVVPVSGPSALLLGLMASGLNGQAFSFHGYLPRQAKARKQRLKQLDREAWQSGTTQIFMETPYRNDALLADVLTSCQPGTLLCIAATLTGAAEFVSTRMIQEWQAAPPALHKQPAVFYLNRLEEDLPV
jgi:16S rRNA (cytidine1402-2'-O)-methyltransferase